MEYVTIVVMLALLQYLYFGIRVGQARAAGRVEAPNVHGDEIFERNFRAHQNTLEQLMIFVPACFASGLFVQGVYVAGIGVLFLIGRALYFNAYVKDPAKRGPGMLVSMLANVVLILVALVSALSSLI